MIRWNNDYNRAAHPDIIEAFEKYNGESYGGYGIDTWCERAKEEIRRYLGGRDCDIHFVVGGTQANTLALASMLRSYESVISADCGHINAHESGSIENTGHKIETSPHHQGKLWVSDIEKIAGEYRDSDIKEHITVPRVAFISFPSEYGTVYSKAELTDIRKVCDEYGLYLYIDGARLGYGIGAEGSEVELSDIARLADVFYIGGTKCGAMFGEALVFCNRDLGAHFRNYMKQYGAMLAKGWTLGIQFYTLFKDGLYLEITKQAVKMAMELKSAFISKGIPLYCDSPTNQLFVILNEKQADYLGKNHVYEYSGPLDDGRQCIRFCTSWATTADEVAALTEDIKAM